MGRGIIQSSKKYITRYKNVWIGCISTGAVGFPYSTAKAVIGYAHKYSKENTTEQYSIELIEDNEILTIINKQYQYELNGKEHFFMVSSNYPVEEEDINKFLKEIKIPDRYYFADEKIKTTVTDKKISVTTINGEITIVSKEVEKDICKYNNFYLYVPDEIIFSEVIYEKIKDLL